MNHLTAAGYSVTVRNQTQAVTGDAYGKSLVIISNSVTSGNVNTKFRNVPLPVLNWEPSLFDDLQMTGLTSGTHYGDQSGQTQVSVVNTGHPLAAGLSGNVQTTANPQLYFWGVPAASADVVATIVGDPGRAALFGYEEGDLMVGLVAPARRAGFFNGIGADFTGNGWALFDAAVKWGIGCGSVTGLSLVDASTGQVIGPLVDGATIYLSNLPASVKIRATLDPAATGSARFVYDGSPSTDNTAPYEYTGGTFVEWLPEAGPHTVTVTPFSAAGALGRQGQPSTVTFTVDQPLAVILASFGASQHGNAVRVAWETVSELENSGFALYRSATADGPAELVATLPSQAPGSTQGASYVYDDPIVAAGQIWYWLDDIALNGVVTRHGPVSVTVQTPTAVTLGGLSGGSPRAGQPAALVVIGLAASIVVGLAFVSRRLS